MAGMEFEYDEQGGTFYYFLLSFLALLLFPATYYLWPRSESQSDSQGKNKKCRCEACQTKAYILQNKKPWKKAKDWIIKLALLVGWVFFIWVAYKASLVELDLEEFDPFAELGIDRGASDREIKKAYRKLSLIYHPDRETGDPRKFMRITKAHAALTNEEAKENWEKYGNPDGPGAMHFGIALPKWIVEKQNSVWVLAAYGLVFMIILPVVVGSWWYRSIKYSAEQILMDTMNLYRYFVHKTPNMVLKRVIMILAASFEYEKSHNNEVVNRPSDNEEIPQLMKDLPHLQEKNKEPPLCSPYSVKARALLHAHLSRLRLPPNTLEIDQRLVVLKAPFLLNEMINIAAMLVAFGHARKTQKPRLDTIENMMKVSQMVVQAVWDTKCSLLQLPHITEDMLRHFVTKRRSIRTIKDFVKMKDEDRRNMLRNLLDEEYENIMMVCASMPNITMTATPSVLDDEDSHVITANAVVTVNVLLEREDMSALFDKDSFPVNALMDSQVEDVKADLPPEEDPEEDEGEEKEEEEGKANENESPARKPKVWEKQKKKKGGKGGKKKGGKPLNKTVMVKKTVSAAANHVVPASQDGTGDTGPAGESASSTPKSSKKSKSSRSERTAENVSTGEESGSEGAADVSEDDAREDGESGADEDDDDYLLKMAQESKKELPDSKSKETHEVHAPFYPAIKYERWWLYIADRRTHELISAPLYVCSLKDKEDFQLKFTAPPKTGKHRYSVILRSDSYFQDFDQIQSFEIDVKEEKKEVESHPQWEGVTDEEEEDKDNEDASDSDYDSDDESE